MRSNISFIIEPQHKSLAGHFPGQPIVPGVVLLEQAIALLLRDRSGQRLDALDEVKFLAPVLPNEEVTIECADTAPDRLVFTGTVANRTVFRVRARLGQDT